MSKKKEDFKTGKLLGQKVRGSALLKSVSKKCAVLLAFM